MTRPLCRAHLRQRDDLGLSLSEFLTHPGIRPLREYGPCQVRACLRERTGGKIPLLRGSCHAVTQTPRGRAGP